ncbi:MAG: rRNA maturation RNase YbeY [Xenococcaceae cyanobacterium MO_207.B15]|nr:rRNA maturation RNase YbeY [Xenococcaceae cyanobacterium MO_207.B15]
MIEVAAYIENTYPAFLEDDLNINTASLNLIPWSDWFRVWLEAMYPNIPSGNNYELTMRLTSDREIQAFNAQYRHKNQPTDVLAFAALETEVPQPANFNEPLYLGDIIISLDTATRQASDRKHSLTEELAWLATHGLLHLLGWDHPDELSLEKMLSQQAELLKIIAISEKI